MINARVPMLLNSRPALNVAPCPPDLHAMSITLLGTPHRGPVQDALRETASCVGLKPQAVYPGWLAFLGKPKMTLVKRWA